MTMRILISRTDGIGDVVLTLPMAGIIKRYFNSSTVLFLGKSYTEPIISLSKDVDVFLNWDEIKKDPINGYKILQEQRIDIVLHVFPNKEVAKICKKVGIKNRIGTSHRIYNWLYCNKLSHFSRKRSNKHESILNTTLLHKIKGFNKEIKFEHIDNFLNLSVERVPSCADILSENPNYFKLILHPKSKGNGREWGLDNFKDLIERLDKNKFRIFVCGSEEEGVLFRNELFKEQYDNVFDLSGKLSLSQYINLINNSNALVASGTGPLHVAAVLNKHAIGLFPPMRPINPERWRPIGKYVKIFCKDKACNNCKKTIKCECMQNILPKDVADYILEISQMV